MEGTGRGGTATLAIVVPTFNRQQSVVRLAAQVAPWTGTGEGGVVAVFYDDGSTDQTYAALQPYRGAALEVVRNEANQGYAETLVRAVSECEAEWIMMVADDDVFVPRPGQVDELTAWLHREEPDFVCTQWLRSDGRLYRGSSSSGPISAGSLRAVASHAPGLVYRSSAARRALPTLRRELDRGSHAAFVYPQVVLAAELFAAGAKALFWPDSLIREGSALPSGIRDLKGRRYASTASRMAQAVAFDQLYRQMEREAPDAEYRRRCRTFRQENEIRLARALTRLLRRHFPRDVPTREMYSVVARSSLRLLRRNLRRRASGWRHLRPRAHEGAGH